MKHFSALLIFTFFSSLGLAVPCTNQDLKNELTKKLTELQVTPDLSPCEISKKSVDFNWFAISLITESCSATPEVNTVLARYQQVKERAEKLVVEHCGF